MKLIKKSTLNEQDRHDKLRLKFAIRRYDTIRKEVGGHDYMTHYLLDEENMVLIGLGEAHDKTEVNALIQLPREKDELLRFKAFLIDVIDEKLDSN